MTELKILKVPLTVDEWNLIKQLLREETKLNNEWRSEIDYILEAVEAAAAGKEVRRGG